MEARTFTPHPKKKKTHRKVRNIPIPGPSSSTTATTGQPDQEHDGWSLVTRNPRQQQSQQRQKQATEISMSSLHHVLPKPSPTSPDAASPDDKLAHLRATLAKSSRRGLFREELLQRLCHLAPSKQAGGLVDCRSEASLPQKQEELITGTTLLLDAYTAVTAPHSSSSPRPRAPEDTLAQLHAQRAKLAQAWRASHARPALLAQVRRLLERSANTTSKAVNYVCLGLGSLSAEATGWKAVSMWQLVIWEDVCALVASAMVPSSFNEDKQDQDQGELSTVTARMIFQDPLFNARDVSFLTALGYEVLDSPAAYDVLDPPRSQNQGDADGQQQQDTKSIVFAPHFPLRFWPQGIRLGKPLFVIGNGVGSGAEELLGKIPGRKVLGRAVALIESLRSESEAGTNDFGYEAEVMRKEIWAREEMEMFLRRWTSVQCIPPDECREALWETVVWSPRDG